MIQADLDRIRGAKFGNSEEFLFLYGEKKTACEQAVELKRKRAEGLRLPQFCRFFFDGTLGLVKGFVQSGDDVGALAVDHNIFSRCDKVKADIENTGR